MKSYFRRFRHARGWYHADLQDPKIEHRFTQSLLSFFDLRLIQWLYVEIGQTSFANAFYRSTGFVIGYDYFINGVYGDDDDSPVLIYHCNSQCEYVKTIVEHHNINDWSTACTEAWIMNTNYSDDM